MTHILRLLAFSVILCVYTNTVFAQQAEDASADTSNTLAAQLNELAQLIERRTDQRNELEKALLSKTDGSVTNETQKLATLNSDLEKLHDSFQLLALGISDFDILHDEAATTTTWQENVVDILKPLTDSLKSVTKKPREIAELRDTVLSIDQKQIAIKQALLNANSVSAELLDKSAITQLNSVLTNWQDESQQLQQERIIAEAQLASLTDENGSTLQTVLPATRAFMIGRGLTILLAIVFGVITWAIMRLLLWIYTRYFTSKDFRRNSTWFRVISYSYYLITVLAIVFTVLAVLYMRQDLLLLALAFLLIAGAAISFRHFVPRYISEARLLLNLGGVRENERVVYNGLPWQIMSLNLYSVLRNPALDGVIRLPLETMSTLVSRPVKHKLWFPSNANDFIILPDGLLGQIRHQTPDLVEISVRGGMSLTYTTSDFYALNIINLSRQDSFGVSITFGLDYSLQDISLEQIPQAIREAVNTKLIENGYEKSLLGLIVELSEASASSLDYLVFATMKSEMASDYYKLERLLTQTCVAVSNQHGWTIPFPQLTVHRPN